MGSALCTSRCRISAEASGRPAASYISATVPATCGAAMLVPDLRVVPSVVPVEPAGADFAARTLTPGPAVNGLRTASIGADDAATGGAPIGRVSSGARTDEG